jgi:hypothetical protein
MNLNKITDGNEVAQTMVKNTKKVSKENEGNCCVMAVTAFAKNQKKNKITNYVRRCEKCYELNMLTRNQYTMEENFSRF